MASVRKAALTASLSLLLALVTAVTAQPAAAAAPRLVGVSAPALGTFPTAEVVRVFLTGEPKTFAESGQLRHVPVGKTIIVSFKTVPTDARWRQVVGDWNNSGRRIWWVWRHEADIPSLNISPTYYRNTYNHLLDVWTPLRSGGNTASMTVLTGNLLTKGTADLWYVPRVDAVGFDIYYLVNVSRAQAYARSKGKQLAIPEWGDGTEGGVGWQGDDNTVAFARAYVGLLDATTFAVCWWSVGHNDLARLPKTLAYLRGLT